MEEINTNSWVFRTGVDKTASGSVYLETPGIKIITQVRGPKEYTDLATSEKYIRHTQATVFLTSPLDFIIQHPIESVILLDRYPKAVIEITVELLEGTPEVALPHILNSCTLALMDASIELRDTMVSCTGNLSSRSLIQLNPSELGSSFICMSYLPNLDCLASIFQEGIFEEAQLHTLMRACRDGCLSNYAFIQSSIGS